MKRLVGIITFLIVGITSSIVCFGKENTLKSGCNWCDSNINKQNITDICFQTDIYEEDYIQTWNASTDGSITAYLTDENTIIVSSNGQDSIKCNSNCSGMFKGFENIESITGLNLFDTSNTTNMCQMFSIGCSEYKGEILGEDTNSCLTELDLCSFDTSNVTTMEQMFEDCDALTELDLSNFNTSNVTSFKYMFHNCCSLQELDLSNFDTTSCKDFSYMFYDCISLYNLDISSFDICEATDVRFMFNSLWEMTEFDLPNFGSNKIKYFRGMFWDCKNVETINLCNIETDHATDTVSVFGLNNCKKLTCVYIPENCKLADADKRNIFYTDGEEPVDNDNEQLDPNEDFEEDIYDGEVVYNDLEEDEEEHLLTSTLVIQAPVVDAPTIPVATVQQTNLTTYVSSNNSSGGGGGGGTLLKSTDDSTSTSVYWITTAEGTKATDKEGDPICSCWVKYNNSWYLINDKGYRVNTDIVLNNGKYYSIDPTTGIMRTVSGVYTINNKSVNLQIAADGSICNTNVLNWMSITNIPTNLIIN